jgi:hypothetical protein
MKQLVINDAKGFWVCLHPSIACIIKWKICPIAWQGQFENKDMCKSIILEAIVDQSLWTWHAFFGLPGGNNDIYVLNRYPVVTDMLRGESMGLNFL